MSSGHALHPEAYADLDDIRDYIAKENPDAADRVMSEIFDAIRGLVRFPHQCNRRRNLTSRPLRFTVVCEKPARLRAGRKATLDRRRDARSPQHSGYGRAIL
jgi:plasmid stabilization system protein ParE